MSKQDAATIRKTLKKLHGITARQVSVRYECMTTSSAITITIKDPDVKLSDVEAVARPFESISRDHGAQGQILGGGNSFVSVDYSDEALAPLEELVSYRLGRLDKGATVEIEGIELWPCTANWDTFWARCEGWDRDKMFNGIRHAARKVATIILNGGAA